MSQATYIQDMMADPVLDMAEGPRQVAEFFAGQNVLLTGGFGFLGQLILERILRSLPDIKTLFLIVRSKKGKSPEERSKELFNDGLFDRLRRERPDFIRKVVLIEGDMMKVGLGLSPEHRELLRRSNIVIHGAASVRFDEKLRSAATINISGTKELLSLAKEMPDLKAFVHISTAYSNCVQELIDEKFYPPPIETDKLIDLMKILDDEALDHLTPVLLGKWPNTYAFTKAIAEDTIRQNSRNLPICIVRPSIVVSTAKEPVAGWVNNIYGATGIVVGAAVGLLRTLHCDPDLVADIIPADYVVNAVLVAAWDIAKSQSLNSNNAESPVKPDVEEPPIYNVVSSCQKPITWGNLLKYCKVGGLKVPSIVCVWYFCFTLNKNGLINDLFVLFLHTIPALIADALAWFTGRKPMMRQTYAKIHKFSNVISYFTLQQWRFQNNGVLRLWRSLSPADRSEFDFNIDDLNWEDYFNHNIRGIRVYIFKDPINTLEDARSRYRKLKIAHYTLMTAAFFLLFWLLLSFLRFVGIC